jgi:hypothetical protein
MDLELLKFGRVLYGDVGRCAARDAFLARDHNVSVCTVRMASESALGRRAQRKYDKHGFVRMIDKKAQLDRVAALALECWLLSFRLRFRPATSISPAGRCNDQISLDEVERIVI